MHVIHARNVHDAIPEGVRYLIRDGVQRDSRNGPVLVAPCPVATVYSKPWQKVEFWPLRDSNPFFHLMEAIWMLAGGQDVEFPSRFNKKFGQFSDNGVTFNGAYGYRWRHKFGFDQLKLIIENLTKDPNDRRQVLTMWNPEDLQNFQSKDVPCNTQVYFGRGVDGKLNMTVCCRSNDMIWGAYGSNAVHFAMLQEYIAAGIGCSIGTYTQISNNFHAYLKTFDPLRDLAKYASFEDHSLEGAVWNPYVQRNLMVPNLLQPGETLANFDVGVRMITSGMTAANSHKNRFLRTTVMPMMKAYESFQDRGEDRFDIALQDMIKVDSPDWQLAGVSWIQRRKLKAEEKRKKEEDNGNAE